MPPVQKCKTSDRTRVGRVFELPEGELLWQMYRVGGLYHYYERKVRLSAVHFTYSRRWFWKFKFSKRGSGSGVGFNLLTVLLLDSQSVDIVQHNYDWLQRPV